MELALILAREVAVMFLFVAVGVICKKSGIVDDGAARTMSNLILMVIIPSLLLSAFQRERQVEHLPGIAATLVLSVVLHLVAIWAANILVKDRGDGSDHWRVARIALVFSNCAFMGFPLLRATLGPDTVIYGAVLTGVFNTINWAWSPHILTGERSFSPGKLLRNPVIIAFLLGMILYLFEIRLPYLLAELFNQLGSINTPLSMLVIGVFLASVNVRDALKDISVYKLILLRNILLPLAFTAIVWALHLPAWLPDGKTVALAMIILMSCPSASLAILMTARYGLDGAYGAKLVAATTLCSLVTLPLITMLADRIL